MSHNGGRSQVNFNFPAGGDFAFLDNMKDASWWVYGNASQFILTPGQVNAQGLPTLVPDATALYCGTTVPSQAERPGNYVLFWTGTATFAFQFGTGSLVSGSLSGTNGRAVFTPTETNGPGNIAIQLTAITSLSALHLCHVDDEYRLNLPTPEVFGVRFLAKVREGNCGVLRFLNWQRANSTNVNAYAHRKPLDYYSYATYEYRSSLWAGSTTNIGNAYSATLSGFSLVDKATLIVQYNATASGTATMNVSGTGAKTIKYRSGESLSGGPISGGIGLLVYDADLNCYLMHGGDANLYIGLDNGFPIEIMVQLCNTVGAHPWFLQPYLTTDSPSDFMGSLSAYCRDNLSPGLVPDFEPPNETWNAAAGFLATPYANNKSTVWWGVAALNDWYGKALSKMGQAVSTTYSGDRSRYRTVCGIWTHDPNPVTDRLDSPRYVVDGGSAAKNWTTRLAMANYWATSYTAQEELDTAWTYNGASASAKVVLASDYVTIAQDQIISSDVLTQARILQIAAARKVTADAYSLVLDFYEGGWSSDYPKIGSNYLNYTPNVTGITNAAQAAVTIQSVAGFPLPPIGTSVSLASVGGMTQVNGNTYTVVARSGLTITINVDSTAFGVYTSGGVCTYVNSGLVRTNLRSASKAVPALNTLTTQFYNNLVALGEFPSHFDFSGGDQAWSIFDPDIYAAPSPQWSAIVAFNAVSSGLQETPDASNWQAHHRKLWGRHKKKKDEDQERRELGILPNDPPQSVAQMPTVTPDLPREIIKPPVKRTVIIPRLITPPRIAPTKEEYDNAYKRAYKAAYMEAISNERSIKDMKRRERLTAAGIIPMEKGYGRRRGS